MMLLKRLGDHAMKMILHIEDHHVAFKEAEKKAEEFNKSKMKPKFHPFITALHKMDYKNSYKTFQAARLET
jgi:hypothetical protein